MAKIRNNFYFLFLILIFFRIFVADMDYTLNCKGRLVDLSEPLVMGIVNATPDSFYADSRQQTEQQVAVRTRQILDEGAAIVDVGACSTRPDSTPVDEAEEMERLRMALTAVRREAPEAVVSVDTFRPNVARMAVEEYGVDIINDVGGPVDVQLSAVSVQREMFRMVSLLRVPYIYMSRKATMREILLDGAEVVDILRSMGQKDIVLDPGFGFGKTLEQNYIVLSQLERMQMMGVPILVGVSRKSMVCRLLGIRQEEALNGTSVLHTKALLGGANILRVHDVRQAVECVKIVRQIENSKLVN